MRLFGRERVCATINDSLRNAASGVVTLLRIEGAVGVGKTALCDYVAGRANEHSVLTRATATEAEATVAVSGLSPIVRQLWSYSEGLAAEDKRRLAQVVVRARQREPSATDLGDAILALFAEAARERVLVTIFDDAAVARPFDGRCALARLSRCIELSDRHRDGEPRSCRIAADRSSR